MTENMTMIAPAGNPSVVSPLTTQVAAKIASGMTFDAAKALVSAELGLNSLDVMKNYVKQKSIDSTYEEAHKIAAAVAEVLKTVDSSSDSNTSLAEKLASISGKVTTQVAPNVELIKLAVSLNDAKTILVTVINNYAAVSTYTLAGTLNGLTTTGLVLSNGTENVSPDANDSTFRFTQKLADNDVYDVRIKSQPVGKICSLDNGFESIKGQSVTNISVTCVDAPGTLTGALSGLDSSGLVIKNGSELLRIQDGSTTFSFQKTVAAGTPFEVTVNTQPIGKTCSVANGTGKMVSSGLNNVQITCANNSYSIAGSIAGLNTAGLRLSNGGELINISSGSQVFTFANPVAYGGGYGVVVDSQPDGHTCSVSNGTGTLGAGNVTSVQITCARDSFNIGGSISGLTAGGLSLINGNELIKPAPGDSSFNFIAKVAYGGSYNISIASQPVGQTCQISNNSVTSLSSNVSSVSVTCQANTYSLSVSLSGLNSNSSLGVTGNFNNSPFSKTLTSNTARYEVTNGLLFDTPYTFQVGTASSAQTCSLSSGSKSTSGVLQNNIVLGIDCQVLAPVVPACTTRYGTIGGFTRIKTICCSGRCTVQSY
jgi:hypothetical protein